MADMTPPIDLAVVGHTNTGKTSLMRTLLRDERFGEVADSPGTTRHVESAQLLTQEGQPILILRDTPGLEDAMGALDYLEQMVPGGARLDGPERIQRLLDSPESAGRFEQECRVLSTVRATDASLYVVDARDPVLPKHKDELLLLAACGRPILPVLNFTRSPQAIPEAWREALARLGLHASVDFDTVAPALDGEARLLDRLVLMLDLHAAALQTLRTDLARQRQDRLRDATRLVAELLMDAAALRLPCSQDPTDAAAVTLNLRKRTRDREQDCVHALLKRYRFSKVAFPHHPLPLEGERWGMDLFSPQTLRVFGIQVGKGLATGAMAGATIDVLTGGLSLGAAALIGAAIGGTWQGANRWGKRFMNRMAGHTEITVDDAVLHLLSLRQLALIRALESRGHAAMQPIEGSLAAFASSPGDTPRADAPRPPAEAAGEEACSDTPAATPGRDTALPLPPEVRHALDEARGHPEWSTLGGASTPDSRRDQLVGQMARALFAAL
ncbi:G domain-containing protein OS=Castellaniella defragrans OX=75697 GN=HNR28_002181 PE=4 SV=1 [Castellaniella defragrans]